MGCPDCGSGDDALKSNIKVKPHRPDPVIEKINEIIKFLTPPQG